MSDRILVAYASRCGSTAEVAEAIGQVLCDAGMPVDVHPVKKVGDLGKYGAVILGTAIRAGQPLPEAVKFAQRNQQVLAQLPVAYFNVGAALVDDTPENREQAHQALAPLRAVREPLSEGLFAGKVDPARLPFIWRMLLSAMKTPVGDFRNWEAIRAWATEAAPSLAKG